MGLLTYLMSFISTMGLRSMKSYTFLEPSRKEAVTLPLSSFFSAPVMTPLPMRSSTPSANISECMPRFLWSARCAAMAFGSEPMPICRQAPSSISPEHMVPIFTSSSPGSIYGLSMSGVSSLTRKSNFSTGTRSPYAKGTFGLTTPMTVLAVSIAAIEQSTEVPRETMPLLSGSLICTIATPSLIAPLL